MKKELCRIKPNVAVRVNSEEEAARLFLYFNSFGFRTNHLAGNSTTTPYGYLEGERRIECQSLATTISFKEFKRIISQPTDETINDYKIY